MEKILTLLGATIVTVYTAALVWIILTLINMVAGN